MPIRAVAAAVAGAAGTIAATTSSPTGAPSRRKKSNGERQQQRENNHHDRRRTQQQQPQRHDRCQGDGANGTTRAMGCEDEDDLSEDGTGGSSLPLPLHVGDDQPRASAAAAVCDEFVPPPAAWFDDDHDENANGDGSGENEASQIHVDDENDRAHQGEDGTPSTMMHVSTGSGEDEFRQRHLDREAVVPVDECAAYDSSFGDHDDGDDDDTDDEDGREGEDEAANNETDTLKQEAAQSTPTTAAAATLASAAVTTAAAGTAAAPTSATTAAMQSIQYTGHAIATSASYHVTTTLPKAAGELVTSSLHRVVHSAKLVYSNRTWVGRYRQHSDLASGVGGYYRDDVVWDIGNELLGGGEDGDGDKGGDSAAGAGAGTCAAGVADSKKQRHPSDPHIALPPFSSLPWVDRQLVKEWRTYDLSNLDGSPPLFAENEAAAATNETEVQDVPPALTETVPSLHDSCSSGSVSEDDNHEDDEHDYVSARTLIPAPLTRPPRENARTCHYCDRPFGPTLHRHHCRLCGRSCCHPHSDATHRLPHLGYDPNVAERVCFRCKSILEERNLAERIAWRLARLRDYFSGELTPYFETGVDTMEDVAVRLTRAAIAMARKIPLGAQATVAVETLEVLRKHGLKGVYGLILRKEFMAAADLLCQACGINRKVWPLSVHELSAAIFYALSHHRMIRGMDPEGEHRIHALQGQKYAGDLRGHEDLLDEEEDDDMPTWADIAGVPQDVEVDGLSTGHEEGEIMMSEGENAGGINTSALIDDADVSDPSDHGIHGPLAAISEHSISQDQSIINLLGASGPQRRVRPLVPVCDPASDSLISSLLFYAPLALNFIYATSEVDIQLLAAQQGWRLLYAHLDQSGGCHASSSSRGSSAPGDSSRIIEEDEKGKKLVADRPAFALLARPDQKLACLTVRGTATINDVVTDIRAIPVPFPPEDEAGGSRRKATKNNDCEADWTSVSGAQGLALCGMARAAINLYRENIDSLTVLAKRGYRVRIVGHSLGGGVAALLGTLVRRHLEAIFEADGSCMHIDDALRVYGYGTPACVDAGLADETASYVTSCVLHDDVVPRLTATSIRGLLKHLLYVRETWVKDHLSADISAYAERAKGAWAPRWRQSFTLIKSTSKKQIGKAKKVYQEYKESVKDSAAGPREMDLRDNFHDKVEEEEREMRIGPSRSSSSKDLAAPDLPVDGDTLEIDGDLFYEAEEDMIESDEDDAENTGFGLGGLESDEIVLSKSEQDEKQNSTTPAVMLEETPLPRMFIPGKIVHIYTHRGAYKATEVPRKFRELRHISLAGNMLSDHLARQYYEALLEVKSVRRAKAPLPEWTGFGEESTCACCASRFTWASTSDTEAQEARDKHNCRMCGGLVCDPCSQNRLPLTDLGITLPSRVCDRCYNDMGGIMANGEDGETMARSFLAEEDTDMDATALDKENRSGSRDGGAMAGSRQRRSVVVDELASRIPSIADALG